MRLRECFHRLRVDGRPKRIKKFAFTIVFVWTGPKGADLINAGVFDIPL